MKKMVRDMKATVMSVGGVNKFTDPHGNEYRWCRVGLIHEGNRGCAMYAMACGDLTFVEPGDVVRVTTTSPSWSSGDKEYLVTGVIESKRSW